MTREVMVNFHGTKLPTKFLDTEVHVKTVTSVVSSTVEITPTPSYLTLTITPTVAQPSDIPVMPKINDLQEKQSEEEEKESGVYASQTLLATQKQESHEAPQQSTHAWGHQKV